VTITEDQLELLRDKYVLWERASREGHPDLRDYNKRAAEALKSALSIVSAAQPEAMPGREDIARIIDPYAFNPQPGHVLPDSRRAEAFAKADAILSLIAKGGERG